MPTNPLASASGDDLSAMQDVELSETGLSSSSTPQPHPILGSGQRRMSGSAAAVRRTGSNASSGPSPGGEGGRQEEKEESKTSSQAWDNNPISQHHGNELHLVGKGEGVSYPDKQR